MFVETSFDENAGEIKEESPGIVLDLDIGKLCISPVPYQSSCVRADESSAAIITSDASVADVLIPSFDSIKFAELCESENDIANDTITADVIGSIWEAGRPEKSADERKNPHRSDFPDFTRTEDSSRDRNGKAESLCDDDKHQKPNHPLIVYRSSRRKNVRNTNNKANQKSEPQNESRNFRKTEKKNSALDLNSLKVSRRRRTLFPKRDRSSVWGLLGNMFPDFEETGGHEPNVGSERNLRSVKGVQGKKSAITTKASKKSVRDSFPPTGRITLKIKIGNQSCGMVHDLNASEKSASGLSKIVGHEEGDKLRASTENRCSDPGTSPDSEVINSIPDATPFEKDLSRQDAPMVPVARISQECLTNSVPDVPVMDGSSLIFLQKKSKKGKKKDKHHKLGHRYVESMLTGANTTCSAKAPMQPEFGQEVVDVSYCKDASTTAFAKKNSNTYSSTKGPKGPSCCSSMTDSRTPVSSKVCSSAEVNPSYEHAAPIESSSAHPGDNLIPCSNGKKFSKCSKAKGQHKSNCEPSDKTSKKEKKNKNKGDRKKLVSRHEIGENNDTNRDLSGVDIHLASGNHSLSDLAETGYPSKGANGSLNSMQFISDELKEQYAPLRNAWVLCDECQKWRRIPAILADQIEETNCGWTCKDNSDKDFADCSIPQEKSDSEINKELEISDAEEDAYNALQKSIQIRSQAVQKPPSWSLIRSNLFLHRSRKTQTIDEVMVCHCKPPADGRMGCGAKCLNRMLNIECVRGTCPCGELCSNQQFQKRKYAKLRWFRCGKKGFGLQALQDISQGQFLIEYVGEVLDMRAYETRQKEYALQGHRHFYFMTLNGSEVIDACAKGNLGRFINHSCDPNCQTEKWMVNGEVCVGLFAVRDIQKGEEVTFDYNYVRVFGAAAKKCVCGSPNCRGYIGGDLTNSEVIVQGDSDEEFAEPVMTLDDREMKEDWNDIISNSLLNREKETIIEPPEKRDRRKKQLNVVAQSENIFSETLVGKVAISSACSDGSFNMSTARQVADIVQDDKPDESFSNDFASKSNVDVELLDAKKDQEESLSISEPAVSNVEAGGAQLVDVSLQPDVMNKALSSAQHTPRKEVTTNALTRKVQLNTTECKAISGGKELVKPGFAVKSHLPSSIKKEKPKSNPVNGKFSPDLDKLNAANHKSKSLPDVTLNNHVETVEKKLNELLDTEGGISKRKDASRGYLKLLFLTANSGTSGHGEAIQSNRDLSMILDALLKTKSRTVLVDIINKNGLQMLHNIMKRYRKEFNKTPILRKLLKVLEYLATREILNLEHITGGPPCPGVESFRDSILTLTDHGDRQVHQIARNFRDRWIPRHLRRKCFMEPDNAKIEFPHYSVHGRPPSASSSQDHPNTRIEKSEEPIAASSSGVVVDYPTPMNSDNNNNGTTKTGVRKRKSRWDTPPPHNYDSTPLPGFSSPHTDDSAPPGFSSPCKKPKDQVNGSLAAAPPFGTVLGNLQPKFAASLPLSYGIPYSVLLQLGVHEAENIMSLKVLPGLPFHPYPPLPTYKKVGPQMMGSQSGPIFTQPAEKYERVNNSSGDDCAAGHLSGHKRTNENGMGLPEMNSPLMGPDFERDGSSHSLGRKFFRQQKWNHAKAAPPWVRMRNGHVGNTRNGGPTGTGFGSGASQFRNSYV
ncbi:histone-lysine N-methyltransferase [Striga asiatica]|uniref:Histone-lysine N-methyltransferase n=1 Tax=Striga asiatica TaxID=4170 RepID=A0A5A7Q5R2_STRAF|nr:histone-lysine N-methyltransferase [Striga asiatica]